MGLLAESRTRRRIQNDPNNTKWTRDTTTFGQKMLRSQGWEPGQFLGAKDAAHSEFHTAANASYIRVSLKDDMKGLGFTKSKEDEVTGLDVFSDLLSRLNGKSEAEVEEKRQARLEVKMHQYVENKWGPMRFVRGGLLVGDAMQETDESKDSSEESDSSSAEDEKIPTVAEETKKEKSKKRKAAALKDEDDMSEDDEEDEKKKKKQRKEERRAKKLAKAESSQSSDSEKAKKKDKKKDKKEKKNGSEKTKRSKKDKKEKKDKKDKKEKKEKKSKDKKKRKNDDVGSDTEMPDAAPQASSSAVSRSGTATPVTTGTSTPTTRGNFITPRSRFIAQKKAAFMDASALKQIFMVKA
ncbi:uncharacterized protein TRIREDRAFT_104535 [Trichoderma reesei QM6a]|uniref:PinX1-related protein 1 n=2 Tax=Hypocrea jecorina TaxID=51453 RepID=G0RCN7_HYPJQ|nr:uncharacterized protein TRIREDRAFT_104535 [Trichoderma reesei QM6a]EGR51258.1 predicted protein [Trichoderma reesei QM6a]ETS04375.1 hypothetical protein M419DRAFT_127502 [Trichoderma reesei RUT C-30]